MTPTAARQNFLDELNALIAAERFTEVADRVIAEGPALGPRKTDWVIGCQWFVDRRAQQPGEPLMTDRWIALQGMFALSYGNL
jgi:hypothetical protein